MLAPFERLKAAVIRRTGHHYYIDKDKLLYERVRERMRDRDAPSLEAYLDLLDAEPAEWRELEDIITVGETYFFRYADHFEALRNVILPRLIEARRSTRSLRIWSLGCSNGAEPYSVAIILRELLAGEISDWRIALVGGDISEKALRAARAARYGSWALRTLGPDDRAAYFNRVGNVWVLKGEYRALVRFERQNILDLLSPTPPLAWNDFDLILCRNVLIYFSQQEALAIAKALSERLASDGVLLLGHAEASLTGGLSHLPSQPLPTEFGKALQPLPPALLPPPPPHIAAEKPAPLVAPVQTPSVPPIAAPVLQSTESDDIERLQLLADAGDYKRAEDLCGDLLRRNPTSARLHYYHAVLRQVSDDPSGAEAALKRAIYLDRAFAVAHHRLGMLLLGMGRRTEARRAFLTAARLAETCPAAQPLAEGQGISAGEFTRTLRQQLAALGDAA